MTRLTKNRPRAMLIAAAAAVGITAGAFGFWMANGSGEATTVLGSPDQLTLSEGTQQGQLSPGRDANVHTVATNNNPYFVTIGSLALDTAAGTAGFDVDAGHSGCDLSAIHFTPQPAPVGIFGSGWRIPPKVASDEGTLTIELSGALAMDADAADACQGASFTIHLVAGA
jgi:hypothetical protein